MSLAARSFALAAADDEQRKEKPRYDPKDRLHHCSVHRSFSFSICVRSLALELGQYGVRANLIAPGLTITEAISPSSKARTDELARTTPLRRNASPEDVAGAILMVASDNAAFVSGAYIPVSGGLNMG